MQTTTKVDELSFWLPINQLSAQMYAGSFFFFIINIVYFKQFFW